MATVKVDESELVKLELSATAAARASKSSSTSLPSLSNQPKGGCTGADAAPRTTQRTTALHLESKTKEIMSLPCTVVCSANGVREILDLTRLHYVTHRLALGQSGMKELVAAEKKILGHSSLGQSANLAVFAVPVMDFEEGGIHGAGSRIAGSLMANDPLILKHSQAMDENIEAIRADRLAQVQVMDGQKFHTLRRKCLDSMTERAMMLDPDLQDVVINGINRTEDIVLHNPGYDDMENGRVQRMTSLHSAAPTVLIAVEQSSSTTYIAPTDEDSSSTVRKTQFAVESSSVLAPAIQSDVPERPQTYSQSHAETSAGELGTAIPDQPPAVKWTKMRQGVDKMTERWQHVDRFRGHSKRKVQLSMADMVGYNNVQTHFLSAAQHAGTFVYTSRCKELGVVPTSRVLDAIATERADVSYARLGDRGVEALSYALAINRIVRVICLKHCHLTAVGIKQLFQSLLVRMNTEGAKELLESALLDMNKHEVKSQFSHQSNTSRTRQRYRALASLNTDSTTSQSKRPPICTKESKPRVLEAPDLQPFDLRVLDVSGNAIGHQGAFMAACFLDPRRSPQQLRELVMDACGITDLGGAAVMAALHGNTVLHTLSMRHNSLAATSAKALGEMMMHNVNLCLLGLSWNVIGPTAGEFLAKGISCNATLQSLDLSWNGLETKGAVAVVNALSSNNGLTMLNLSSTRMSDRACPSIAAALAKNSVLEHLMLNSNGITEAGTHTLIQALQINHTLKHLSLMVRSHANSWHGRLTRGHPETMDEHAFGCRDIPYMLVFALQWRQAKRQPTES